MKRPVYLHIKYALDKVLALLGLIVLSPLFLLLIILVAFDGKGKVLFRQEREGQNREIFRIYKFRTMKRTDVEFDKDRAFIESNNVNVTRVGRGLRRCKLDELPQLVNILKGEMSFVGPRPLLPVYSNMFEKWEHYKFVGRPGLTGLAQINGNGLLSVRGRNYYDVVYNEKTTFFTDVKIVFLTVVVLFKGEKRSLNEPTEDEIRSVEARHNG